MSRNRKITIALLFGAFLVLGGWDLYAAVNSEDGDTISEIAWAASTNPAIPFVAGFVMGHLFWPKRP